jgi:hypothetical protein
VDALPVLLDRPIRSPARPESVALVRSAQPVVCGTPISILANGEPFAIDLEGEQHRSGPSLSSAVHSWNGGTVAVTAGAPVHKSQHPRLPTSSPSRSCSADALICHDPRRLCQWAKLSCRAVPLAAVQGHAVVVAKYDGLAGFLRRQQDANLQVTFEQLAAVVPGGLPPSAYQHRAWWANEVNGWHVHACAWLGAGWVVSGIDLAGQVVTFQRV